LLRLIKVDAASRRSSKFPESNEIDLKGRNKKAPEGGSLDANDAANG